MRTRIVGVPGALAWGLGRMARDRLARGRTSADGAFSGFEGAAPVAIVGDAPPFPGGRPLRIVCWNLQYCGGRSGLFFYEGGSRVYVDDAERDRTLAAVIATLRELAPDVVLLQEVDVRSDRTGRLDQRAALVDALDFPTHASTPYHEVPYLPVPSRSPLGRVRLDLLTLSRWRLSSAVRHPLPLMVESAFRRAYNLRRAVLETRVQREGARDLALLNLHLSAFSRADGTLARQVSVVDALCREREEHGVPWLVAGDFNALPPWDDAARLAAEHAAEYGDADPPLAPLFSRWSSPLPKDARWPEWGTYVPIGASEADRTIDHVFHGPAVSLSGAFVRRGLGHVSDHLPLVVDVAP